MSFWNGVAVIESHGNKDGFYRDSIATLQNDETVLSKKTSGNLYNFAAGRTRPP